MQLVFLQKSYWYLCKLRTATDRQIFMAESSRTPLRDRSLITSQWGGGGAVVLIGGMLFNISNFGGG